MAKDAKCDFPWGTLGWLWVGLGRCFFLCLGRLAMYVDLIAKSGNPLPWRGQFSDFRGRMPSLVCCEEDRLGLCLLIAFLTKSHPNFKLCSNDFSP